MNTSDLPVDGDAPGINRLFVTVGTDYHRFDRMVWWLDEWLAGEPKVDSVIVQRGTSAESERAESVEYLQRSQLVEEFQNASAVVCHGGPATILECRSNGIVPIVVPREERFDEHVNDHQVDFCERLATHGEIQLARTKDEFFRLLDLAVQRGAPIVAVDDGHSAESLANFEEEMVELLGPRARTLPSSWQRSYRSPAPSTRSRSCSWAPCHDRAAPSCPICSTSTRTWSTSVSSSTCGNAA